jgi:hypothetical protein
VSDLTNPSAPSCCSHLQGPALKKLCEQLAKELGSDTETITRRLEGLHECNPMMGLRGCRLGTVHPEITAMQVGCSLLLLGLVGCLRYTQLAVLL